MLLLTEKKKLINILKNVYFI
jgi:beta-1,4-mannosyltransferase